MGIMNVPQAALVGNNLQIRVYVNYRNNGNDWMCTDAANNIYETYEYAVPIQVPDAPLGLTATTNQCGQITLNWSNPTQTWSGQLNCIANQDYNYEIYRNGVKIGFVTNDAATSFVDNTPGLSVGQTYQYSVKTFLWNENGYGFRRSSSSNVAIGSMLMPPAQPSPFSASKDKCNSSIELTWAQPSGVAANSYSLITAPFTASLSSSLRSYIWNTSITRGTTYNIKLVAKNTCGYPSDTASILGISPADPAMATSVTAVSNTLTGTIDLTWQDNANNETKYQIVRTDDEGNTILTDINPNQTSYNDASAASCRLYTYKIRVFNDCVLSGIVSTSQATVTLPPPNLGNTFTTTKRLVASKGYFGNRVELSWSNNNAVNIDVFKIYRKQLGTVLDSVQIAASGAGTAMFIDNTADARVFYRYTIVGVKNCNGSELLTNISSDIGFRNPTGLVSGHIEYNGGIAVGGVKVFIQQNGSVVGGNALDFNNGGSLTIQDKAELEPGAQMRCEFWMKPTAFSGTTNIINKTNAFDFANVAGDWRARIFTGGTAKEITVAASTFATNQWSHVSMVYDGTVLKLYANGILSGTVVASGSIDDNANNLVFGGATSDFLMDEFRLIGQSATDSVITVESNRILNGDELGFKCNLHFNEAVGAYAYDASKVGNFFNGNHGLISGSVTWSNDKPSNSQLGYFGVTDALGNYLVTGIQYIGTGENFNVVPNYQTHSFTPNSRSVFIGDGSYVYNNQDFLDNSSFVFSGTLFYKNTTCPVPGASLKIDGLPVIKNGNPVLTNSNGTFSVSVPIGEHFVEVEKFAHTMELGRYPAAGVHNFQAPISGVTFVDSTLRTIVGRVVGGLVEENKKPGMGRSKNNIGKARIRIVPLSGAPCFVSTVVTNSLTGEYIFRVPPLAYKVDSAYVITNPSSIGMSNLSRTGQMIDLTSVATTTTVIDSVLSSTGVWTGVVDSVKYHIRRDFVYRSAPEVEVFKMDGSRFIGEDSLKVGASKVSIKPTAANNWGPLNWPVFKQANSYQMLIKGSEFYVNNENGVTDTVRLDGNVKITNGLISGTDPSPIVPMSNGIATYSFTCGEPNNSTNPDVNLSYTKQLQVQLEPDGASPVTWEPNLTSTLTTNPNYHAIVMGQKITGTGISTQGPERVDYILRDPPGSGSSASWGSGTTVTKSTSYSRGVSQESETTVSLLLGKKALTGAIAYYEEIEVDNTVGLGFSNTYEKSKEDSYTETMTTFNTISTRDDPDNVGAPADIFIGRARNWLVGPTNNIELVPVATCTASGNCFGPTIGGYRMSKTVGYAIAPNGVRTRFSYTKKEIEEVVIPTLESIRATYLTSNPRYTSHLPSSDPLFGCNNDDELLSVRSTTTPTTYEQKDTTGISYTFRGIKYFTDTVRVINTQIALWKQTLAQNEREKYKCVTNTGGTLIDNFTLGSAIVNNSYSLDQETTSTETYELALGGNTKAELGAAIGGIGFKADISLTVMETKGNSSSNGVTNSSTFEYTLTDGDPGDIMSIDVYKSPEGTGNVFVTRGGQTMCPYEDAVKCHYYNPANPSGYIGSHTYNANGYYTIANATVQREMPNIVITPAIQYNIPSNQPAVFQLLLTNQSPLTVNNDIDLRVRVSGVSNPDGAVLKIDGQSANNIYNIPSGGSVVKTLTIERGPIEIDYDSLMVIFSSACSEDIADTAYVSVHFIPSCTDLAIIAPSNNFIINNYSNEVSQIQISNYNYNYGAAPNTSTVTSAAHPYFGLEKFGFEFKPANSSQWLQVQDFFKYPSALGASTLHVIPNGQIFTPYTWSVTTNSYADGNYEIRAVSYCYNKDGSYATVYSPVLQGVMDRVNPHPFGTPSPGDGILDPNDDISIKFNETIDISSLSYAPVTSPSTGNFDVRGVLNGTDIRHSESLNFDGTSDYAEVSGGVSLQKRPFTFEFWAKFNPSGAEQTLISQGTDAVEKMTIGFDATNRLKFALGNQTATSTNPVGSPSNWHHYAVVFDYVNSDVSLYIDGTLAGTNNNFLIDYIGSGKLAFGKALPANNNFLNGNIHEVRLWNKARTISEITVTMNKVLNSNQSGLVYNWKMDEADGVFAKDDIRSRNADIYGATWEVNPNGSAAEFDGADDNIEVSSGNITINKEMDFTLEFWFNSNQPGVATLFSNGAGVANTADSLNAWTIQKDGTGKIHVYHKGLDFVAVSNNFFDGNWHHFALVMNRTANLSAYVDGNIQNSVQGINFHNLSGSKFFLGAKATVAGSTTTLSDYYAGKMDEFRLWNTARKAEQIKRDKQNRMLGDESGLMSFVPFENYAVVLGTPSLTPTFNNQSQSTLTVTPNNGPTLVSQTPTIKLPRPVQSVNYTWSLNNDQIILSTTTDPAMLENVTLDITVQNVLDMRGNKMQSPKTWIAYINKNQVKWQDDQFDFEKTVDSVITFVAPIVNSGGAQKAFTIGGLPSWITTSSTTGVIAPNSVRNVTFTIPAGQAVGDYNAGITVTTDFGFDEVLQINLKVKGVVPTWTVNPANYQYQMNVFGQLKIDGIIATNPESKIAAFCNGTVRGVANLQYVPAYDRYEAFLNIYSNSTSGDSIYFNIYDASTGVTFVTVDSSLTFVVNQIIGTVANPRTFSANSEISRSIVLNTGWTWVSFPLKTSKMNNSNSLLSTINPSTGDIITGSVDYDQYDASLGWLGNITGNGGFKNNQSYKVKKAVGETLLHIGARLNPDSIQANINVVPGWNWIGFVASKNLPIAEALGNYNATTGDIIKSQYEFAYYDNLTGWSGSLTTMRPTMGYMLKSSGTSTFNYPLSGFFGAKMYQEESNQEPQTIYPFTPEQYSNTMSLIVKGNICSEVFNQGNIALGLFDNSNALRGYAYPTLANNAYKFYITAYSNTSAENLKLQYFNTVNGAILPTDTTVMFNVDAMIGTPSKPIRANVHDSLACKLSDVTTSIDELDNSEVVVSPNPFEDNFSIKFPKELNAKVEVLDVLGKIVYTSDVKNKKVVNLYFIKSSAALTAGMYYIRISGDVNTQIKVIKTK
jgi:hypothetical protein